MLKNTGGWINADIWVNLENRGSDGGNDLIRLFIWN